MRSRIHAYRVGVAAIRKLKMVGGTGIEPVPPTMSSFRKKAKPLKIIESVKVKRSQT